MKKLKIGFVERKFDYFVSVENVFRRVAEGLDPHEFDTSFRQLRYSNSFSGMVRNLLTFLPDREADVYHVTGHCHYIALALPADRTVLTVHDLGFLHTRAGLRRWALKKLLLDWPLRRLKYVTAISQATADEIERQVPSARTKVRVIENPLDDSLCPTSTREFDESEPHILQIGTSANKNVGNLVRALKGLPCRLTIVGELGLELVGLLREFEMKHAVLSRLSPGEMRDVYESCDIVAFCSTYEGFGLPIIEGQAMLKPIVTSDLSPMREVAGPGGAVLVDPENPGEIRKAIEAIVADRRLRERLVDQGRKNVARFDKRAIAAQYAELYREVVDGSIEQRSR